MVPPREGEGDELEGLIREAEHGGVKMEHLLDRIGQLLSQPVAEPPPEAKEEDIRTLLSNATLPQKIKYAMFGNAVCRTLLIFDPNKMIQGFVLRNPKLTPMEIHDFARNPNCPEGVLRAIADRREWMKDYALKLILVKNPKTPGDVALKWLRYLTPTDLKDIARSKYVPQLVAVTAKKRVVDLERRK